MTKPNLRPCYYLNVQGGEFFCDADEQDEFNCPKKPYNGQGERFVPSIRCMFAYKKKLDYGQLVWMRED